MHLLPKFSKSSPSNDQPDQSDSERTLMQYEAKIGGQLFGPIPEGHYRDFFCLDRQTWIWYEEWTDQNGKRQSVTTRYAVRPNTVLKSQNGHPYQRLSQDEARNLHRAINMYRERVGTAYQQMLQTA